jgi:hypothetical protein
MGITATSYVFNFQAFMLGCGMLFLCLVVHAFFVLIVTTGFKSSIQQLIRDKKKISAQMIFFLSIVVLLISHLIQIYAWGLFTYLLGVIPNEHHAMVFAGSTYTTVGFTTDPLPQEWQLLTIIMAVSGLFSFGWSTAIMFILSQALFPSEK